MKFKCEICGKKIETNDCVLELQICLSSLHYCKPGELGDLVHSPLYSIKICSWCGEHVGLVLSRGMQKINEDEK